MFTHRGEPGGATSFVGNVSNLVVENFESQDPLPSMNAFQLVSISSELRFDKHYTGTITEVNSMWNINFTNVAIAATNTARLCESNKGCNCLPSCATGSALPLGLPNIMAGCVLTVDLT